MKAMKTNDGNLAIIFTQEEREEIINLFSSSVTTMIQEDPMKGLHNKSKLFIKELHSIFGHSKINRKDPRVRELAHKYYITDVANILKALNKSGFCFIQRKQDNKASNVDYFTLNF